MPGFSSTLEAKRDIFGHKIQSQAGYPQSAFNPFGVSLGNNDPVLKEMSRLAQSDAQSQFSTPGEHVGNVDLTTFKNTKGQTAYDRLSELTGKGTQGETLKQAFLYRMQSPSYMNGSDRDSYYTASSRVNMLRDVQNQFKDRAFRQVQNEFPVLREALLADRQNKVDVGTGKTPRNAMDAILKFGDR